MQIPPTCPCVSVTHAYPCSLSLFHTLSSSPIQIDLPSKCSLVNPVIQECVSRERVHNLGFSCNLSARVPLSVFYFLLQLLQLLLEIHNIPFTWTRSEAINVPKATGKLTISSDRQFMLGGSGGRQIDLLQPNRPFCL